MTQAPASQHPPLREGDTVAQFRLIARLGEGGMGVVFKAEDRTLRRTVALKLLHPRVALDPDKKRRFLREGRLAAHLTHPCIATVYEVGEADGRIFIAMELCEGRGLKSLVQEYKALPYPEAIRVVREIGRGLRKAHEAGIIHRDLKPDNIMVGEDGIVKILDFGIAKPTESFDVLVSEIHTQHGSLLGTPAYMSPEQATGKSVDARSDLFSLGVVLYELLTGRRPFEGETWQDMIIAINRDTAKPPSDLRPDLPPDVDRLLAQCMAKSPKDRYPSIRELMEDIDRVLAGAGVFRPAMPTFTGALPPPAGPVITGPPSNETHLKTKPRALLFVVAGLLAVAAIAAGVLVALGRGSAEGEPASAASITATADPIAAPSPPPTATAAGAITETPTPSAQPEASAQVEAPAPPVKGPPRADRAAPPPPASASAKPKNPILGF